jgi:hypothetical protein
VTAAPAASGTFPIRVAVPDVWDHVTLDVNGATTVGEVKRRALEQALGRSVAEDLFLVKHRGGEVLDETITLERLGARANSALIVLPTRRRPVR